MNAPRKIWVALATVVLATTTTILVVSSTSKREPAIIRELGGVLVAEQGVIGSDGMRHLERIYRMETDYRRVKKVMERDLQLSEWMWFPDIETDRDSRGTTAWVKWEVTSGREAFLFEERGTPVYVTWRQDQSWLDRQWFSLKRLIGLERQ